MVDKFLALQLVFYAEAIRYINFELEVYLLFSFQLSQIRDHEIMNIN